MLIMYEELLISFSFNGSICVYFVNLRSCGTITCRTFSLCTKNAPGCDQTSDSMGKEVGYRTLRICHSPVKHCTYSSCLLWG